MNDLISRSNLLQMEKLLMTDIVQNDKVAKYILEQVLYDIEHVPTAFDVDKLLEDIKSRRSNNLRCSKMQINPVSKKIAYYNRAVEDEAVINIIENEINKRKEEKKNNGKNKIN